MPDIEHVPLEYTTMVVDSMDPTNGGYDYEHDPDFYYRLFGQTVHSLEHHLGYEIPDDSLTALTTPLEVEGTNYHWMVDIKEKTYHKLLQFCTSRPYEHEFYDLSILSPNPRILLKSATTVL